MSNKNLHKAKEAKNDEFYTQLYDIENEILRYVTPGNNPFEGKTVLCPCDDPLESNFTRFFAINFSRLGLKKFISTGYKKDGKGKKYVLEGDTDGNGVIDVDDIVAEDLEGDGDFRSAEVTALRDEADIICTNPPFSLFREFIKWINPNEKKFIILGNIGAAAYKDVFPLIKDNKIWLGIHSNMTLVFELPSTATEFHEIVGGTKYAKVPACAWYTNIAHYIRRKPLNLLESMFLDSVGIKFKHYINYDAIDIPSVNLLPADYDGMLGVPISFLSVYNPDQFEIIGLAHGDLGKALGISDGIDDKTWLELKTKNKSIRRGDLMYTENNGTITVPFNRLIIRKK